MAGLTQKELTILVAHEVSITLLLIPTRHKGENWWWMMQVESQTFAGTREVQTARGIRKLWRRLDSIETFIREIFPDRSHVLTVQIESQLRKKSKTPFTPDERAKWRK